MNTFFFWSGQEFDLANYLAIASAARNSLDDVVLLVDERPRNNPHFARLARLDRVEVHPLVAGELMSAAHRALYRRMRFVAHRADLVRFSVLRKYGGIYLDTDTLTVRPPAPASGRLLLEDEKIVHIGVLALPRGDVLAERMMASFLEMPDADLEVYQSVVHRWTAIVRSSGSGVEFGELAEYFPVHWRDWELIFQENGFTGEPSRIRVLHHYGYFSRKYTATMDERWLAEHPCLFSALARQALGRAGSGAVG